MAQTWKIAVLAGDGIGPEIMAEALKVLRVIEDKRSLSFKIEEALIGGAAFEQFGQHFPAETFEICDGADAVLFGAVGGPSGEQHLPKWKNCEVNALLGLRKAFSFGANLRPARVYPQLSEVSPLRNELLRGGVDVLIVRELLGGVYFGEKGRLQGEKGREAFDHGHYNEEQISSVAKIAFEAAERRRNQLTLVDKANVLETSRLWREVVSEVATQYPDVSVENMYVDNCAMQLVQAPARFDVILTENLFGDILSDLAAVLPGSLGLLCSASLSQSGKGLFEPPGGSAPDIAGKNIANPIGQIRSLSMLLEHACGLMEEARMIEEAVERLFSEGFRTTELSEPGTVTLSCSGVGDKLSEFIQQN